MAPRTGTHRSGEGTLHERLVEIAVAQLDGPRLGAIDREAPPIGNRVRPERLLVLESDANSRGCRPNPSSRRR